MLLTKTNFLLYKECPQNAWVKIFQPEIYNTKDISDFDMMIMRTGNEIDEIARELFPGGVLVENRKDYKKSEELINKNEKIVYQPVFCTDKFEMIPDMLVWNDNKNAYDIYEAKSTSSNSNKHDEVNKYDLAFQVNVLKIKSIPINKVYIIKLNSDYIREGDLNLSELFVIEDFTNEVTGILDIVLDEMETAHDLLKKENKPDNSCSCIVKGRSAHCTSFDYLNPQVPEYSVHDISRIGNSKKKLSELIDRGIYSIFDVPEEFKLSDIQRNQVNTAISKKIIFKNNDLNEFFSEIVYPISFLDYETYPAAVPRFSGYSPYNQIPFQFSLHIKKNRESKLEHFEFIHTNNDNPDDIFIQQLKKYLPIDGSIIVWSKQFESGINRKLADRNSESLEYLNEINDRIVDLLEPFQKQFYVHPEFKGKTSIKYILPALAPQFSYKELNIHDGGMAADTWNKIVSGMYSDSENENMSKDLLSYCELDTLAMFEIWDHCIKQLELK